MRIGYEDKTGVQAIPFAYPTFPYLGAGQFVLASYPALLEPKHEKDRGAHDITPALTQ